MKKFKSLLIVASIVATISCSNDDNTTTTPQSNSLADVIENNSSLNSLEAALKKVNLFETLKGDVNFTIFAPTDEAFADFLSSNGFSSLEQVPNEALTQILLNHVLGTKVPSNQVATGYVSTLAKGGASATNELSLYINVSNSGVVLNGTSTVTSYDLNASNGVIHIVDSVIGLPTIVTHALANPDLSILVSALTRDDQPNFVGILSGTESSHLRFLHQPTKLL